VVQVQVKARFEFAAKGNDVASLDSFVGILSFARHPHSKTRDVGHPPASVPPSFNEQDDTDS
jgi:hypothetical protein